mmetsp:Transcript_24942/g.39443  ORF Transcript_24942/g.39443 Transcript_24942/m.39443 type:complete len:705 (-) Transcript_24942:344-2458(-)
MVGPSFKYGAIPLLDVENSDAAAAMGKEGRQCSSSTWELRLPRLALILGFAAAAGFFFVAFSTRQSSISTSQSHQEANLALKRLDKPTQGDISVANSIEIFNDYPNRVQLDLYNFDADEVVEPYRTTFMKIPEKLVEEGSSYSWLISDESGNAVETYAVDGSSSTVSVMFTKAGQFYAVHAQQTNSGKTYFARVICKYVRREIRDLNEKDRQIFLNALKTYHTTESSEGKRLYGQDFFNYRDLMEWHLVKLKSSLTGNIYTPWHAKPGFLTSHLAVSQSVERVLQLIDPSIALPYWDFVADAAKWGPDAVRRSPVLSGALLGSSFPAGGAGAGFDGFWADLPLAWVDQVTPAEEASAAAAHRESAWGWVPELAGGWGRARNAAGLLTNRYNADDGAAGAVGRWGEVCGRTPRQVTIPGCDAEEYTLGSRSLAQAYDRIDGVLHNSLHFLLGGAWNCAVDAGAALRPGGALAVGRSGEGDGVTPAVERAVDAVLGMLPLIWRAAYGDGLYVDDAELVCKDIDVTSIDEMSDSEVYDYLDEFDLVKMLKNIDGTYLDLNEDMLFIYGTVDGEEYWRFKGADDKEDAALKRFLLKIGCTAGALSAWTSPEASPADPLFLPAHSNHHRHWARIQLTTEDLDLSWPTGDVGGCWGHGEFDALPFTEAGLFGEGSAERLTNRRLLEAFDPRRVSLPYIHDSLEFKSCIEN